MSSLRGMSSGLVPLKTRRAEGGCKLNVSSGVMEMIKAPFQGQVLGPKPGGVSYVIEYAEAQTSSRWCGIEVRRGECQPRCRHLTMVQNDEIHHQ
ncbi:hypothetical protein TNCV_2820781 [Trichonephila clavipes]|nr:hypothetical protein TNCV_2820781 [Trichonephila clavipes]